MASLPVPNPTLVIAGIDVAKATLDIAVGVTSTPLTLPNDHVGFDSMLEKFAGHHVALIVMEAKGAGRCLLPAHRKLPGTRRPSSIPGKPATCTCHGQVGGD